MSKPGGRPRLNDQDKRTLRLPPIRCNQAELDAIKSRADEAGLSVSEYARRMLCDGKVIVRGTSADFALVDQIRRIGVNLNQLTAFANRTGKLKPRLSALLDDIEAFMLKVIDGP